MSHKIKFKPRITRIKLNPEQAVLACMCYNTARANAWSPGATTYSSGTGYMCIFGSKQTQLITPSSWLYSLASNT